MLNAIALWGVVKGNFDKSWKFLLPKNSSLVLAINLIEVSIASVVGVFYRYTLKGSESIYAIWSF